MLSHQQKVEWAPLIGRFVIAFSVIEEATRECLRRLQRPGDPIVKKGALLTARINLICEKLKLRSQESPSFEPLLSEFQTLRNCVARRNIVIHDGFTWQPDPTSRCKDFRLVLGSERSFGSVSMGELVTLTDEIDGIGTRIMVLMMRSTWSSASPGK